MLALALSMQKWWELNIINGTVHTGLAESLVMTDFAKEWVEYPIALVSITITKHLFFCNAIANLSMNGT